MLEVGPQAVERSVGADVRRGRPSRLLGERPLVLLVRADTRRLVTVPTSAPAHGPALRPEVAAHGPAGR